MGFDAFRKNGGPTYYDAVHIPWETDLVTSGLIFSFVILAFSFYIILPGMAGKEKLFSFIRITLSLFIGAVILVSNFSMTWETASTSTLTKYKAGTGQEVNVSIGVNIGFRGINITLKGDDDQIIGETINYNEHFSWEGLQGRFGFGPFSGRFNQEYRAAQQRGLPLPILWIAEYFTIDGEGIRWGRHYRQAGWYSHIMLWLAFPLWLLSNILFFVLLRYGAYFLVLTGLSMIISNIIWATLRNVVDLVIPFTTHDKLEFSYGGSFWVCLITGIVCVVLGIVVFLMDKLCPTYVAAFFGVDVLQDSESIVVEEDDEQIVTDQSKTIRNQGGSGEGADDVDGEDDDLYQPPPLAIPQQSTDRDSSFVRPPIVRKKSYNTAEFRITKRLQRPRRRDPPPRPVTHKTEDDEDENLYLNDIPMKQTSAELSARNVVSENDELYTNGTQIQTSASRY
ncbi:dual oxidase maturation factor 1 [Biomphalaria glabrata]|uniref:Dual oxidase maturation factor 1 n=1 Tax=Biomphalaria glabrata TaxID=6526 RepID=A0A182YU26_BIOGL|nr:dual oxidase maturation factor 1 [Biomphalaria glabrata]